MDPLKNVPEKYRPLVIIAIAAIPALLVWAKYDAALRRERADSEPMAETQPTSDLPTPAPAPAGGQPAPSGKPTTADETSPFAVPTTWRSVASADGKFRLDLPDGTRLVQSEGYTYVMADPPSKSQELPYMAIKIATGVDKQAYRPDPNSSVMLDIGLNTYWLYTWEFAAWEPFARVVASFKVIE